MIGLQLGAPNGADFVQFLSILFNFIWIKQIRVFVELILQPEMKLPKIVPDPR